MDIDVLGLWSSKLKEIAQKVWNADLTPFEPFFQPSQDLKFGDYATGVLMKLSKPLQKAPRAIYEDLKDHLTPENFLYLDRAHVAGAGFVNFFLNRQYWHELVRNIRMNGADFGKSDAGKGQKVLLEYVSANPTGPVTIAAARQAAVGDSLSRIMTAAGYHVTREYYVNDVGGQIDNLGKSIFVRYAELHGKELPFPEQGYHGEYVKSMAAELKASHGESLLDDPQAARICADFGKTRLLDSIRRDLASFRTEYDVWSSQEQIEKSGKVKDLVDVLRSKGLTKEQDGALWFLTTKFGDEKDRVLVKSDGAFAYRTPDIAYHKWKFDRGFDRVIDLLGPDHVSHAQDMHRALQALDLDPGRRFKVLIVQHCRLMKDGQEVKMSKRLATYVTLSELMEEVGVDVARYFFLMRKTDSHLDFDIGLAKQQSKDNPYYYASYAHARICSIIRKGVDEKRIAPGDVSHDSYTGDADLQKMTDADVQLVRHLNRFKDAIAGAAADLDTVRITNFLRTLSQEFQSYYEANRVLDEDPEVRAMRLFVAGAVQQVIRNGFALLGVTALSRM